ncbi:MAG: hypothetical protein GY694_20040, partial [Gammaproteobacteria bacterium]|nr:hypothetical protein [Gammaproteobacteria bacterium]
ALTDSVVNVALDEYGLVINRTLKLTALGFLQYDADIANIVGYSGGSTLDQLAATELYAGDNVIYSDGSGRATIDTETITAHMVREAVANLNSASAMPFHGPPRAEGSMTPEPSGSSAYAGVIHPDIALDLREETGSAAWSDPVAYSAADRRWNNELGKFEGVR